VWLDNAATTQKPASVIARLKYFYEHENSNVHRGAHELAARATDAYEGAREKVRGFLNARSANEIVFARGATEAINLVAQSWGRQHVGADDEIIVSHLEHHANIVPWQQLAEAKGAKLRVIPVDDSGQILFDEYLRLLTPRTKIVSVSQVSNALGTVTPVKAIVEQAKRNGVRTLVDGAQAVSHKRVDVREIERLVCLLRPQGLRPDRHRRALRPRGLVERQPPLAGRRQHDQGRDVRAHVLSGCPGAL